MLVLSCQGAPLAEPVDAENRDTSCDLQILVYQAAEPVASQGPDGRAGGRGSAAGWRVLIK